MEDFVEVALLLGRALNEALKGILLGSLFHLFGGHAVFQFIGVAVALKLLSQVELGAHEDAWAGSSACFNLRYPLLARIQKRVTLHQAEANHEAVGVCVGNRAQSS